MTIPEYIEIRSVAGSPVAFLSPEADGLNECYPDAQLNRPSTLTFTLPLSSEKRVYLTDLNRIIAGGREYVILKPDAKEIIRQGKKTWEKVMAQESWVLLDKKYATVSNDPENPTLSWGTVAILSGGTPYPGCTPGSAESALSYLLEGSGWTLGTVDVAGINDLETEKESLLSNINKVQQLWGGYLVWDSLSKILHLRTETAWQNYTGFQIRYAKNLKHITRTEDNDLVTRLYPFGADDLNIASVNNDLLYLDNFQYTTEIYEGIYPNQDITEPQQLKEKALEVLGKLSKPRHNYRVGMVDLRTLPEYSHEDFAMGDMVDIIDEEMGIEVRARVIRHKYNLFQPWKCELEVGDPIESLAAMIADSRKAAEFVRTALRPNAGIGNMLKGFLDTFATVINGANGDYSLVDGVSTWWERDTNGNRTGRVVRITPTGIGISNDGGQTFKTAITGDGILANIIIASELYALSSEDGFTKLVSSGLKVFDDMAKLRVHLGQYAAGKFGLKLLDKTGTQTILDEDGIIQTWEQPKEDNVDASNPLQFDVYIPAEVLSIKKAFLRVRLKAFRAYETAAASGGGSSTTSSSQSTVTQSSTTSNAWDLYAINVIDAVSYEGAHDHGGSTGSSGSHNHGIANGTSLRTADGGSVTWNTYNGHNHLITTEYNHSHSFTADHRHDVTIPGHAHTVQIPAHTHGIVYGIYEGTLPGDVTIKINGVDRTLALGGPFNLDQTNLNIAPYLQQGNNLIELGSSTIGRIAATVFIQCFLTV